tara:strand:+ start:3221 stop:3634 length:414 start_codon:yes stop_codon:yes gene_type:complete
MATTLTSGVALVSSRIYISRTYPVTSANLPALTVYAGSETSSLVTIGISKTLQRTLSVNVDVYARATSNLDDDIDAITVQVEEAIAADFTVNGLAKEALLTSTDIEYSGEAEQQIGIAHMVYDVLYHTSIADVETAK